MEKALLFDGKMEYTLFEYELKEKIKYWTDGMVRDNDLFVLILTENRSHIAMLLITKEKEHYINEEARSKLQQLWPNEAYLYNLRKLIPMIAAEISKGIIFVNGVKYKD